MNQAKHADSNIVSGKDIEKGLRYLGIPIHIHNFVI